MVREDGEFEDDCAELLKIHTRGQRLGCEGQGQVFVLNAGKMFQSGREAGRELRLMSKLRGCAGVVSLAGFVRKRSGGACYGTMVMELCGPSLCHRLIKGGPLGEKEAAKTIQRLAEALKGIHTSGIIHRNLKPENIFVKLDATAVHEVVIGDFGVATDDPKEMSQYYGTGKYMAPEVTSCKGGHGDARTQSFYTTAIDVWALGVITYELLRGYKQFREIELFRAGEFPDGCPLSDEAEDFICGMPIERLTLDGVLEHPWIVENCSSKIKKTIHRRRRCGVKRSAPGFSSDLVVTKVRAA